MATTIIRDYGTTELLPGTPDAELVRTGEACAAPLPGRGACAVSTFIVIGSGPHHLRPERLGQQSDRRRAYLDWALAIERGDVDGLDDMDGDAWCVVVDDPEERAEDLPDHPAIIAVSRVPQDSPALAHWRAGRNPLRMSQPLEGPRSNEWSAELSAFLQRQRAELGTERAP